MSFLKSLYSVLYLFRSRPSKNPDQHFQITERLLSISHIDDPNYISSIGVEAKIVYITPFFNLTW